MPRKVVVAKQERSQQLRIPTMGISQFPWDRWVGGRGFAVTHPEEKRGVVG